MLSALRQLFTPAPTRRQAHELYAQVVAQARNPVFYSQWQVEDTVDGRFDVIILHLFLVLSRLERDRADAQVEQLSRHLSEVFFADMDRSLREMGVTDTGVSVRIKKMAQAYYGRMKAYADTVGERAVPDETLLAEALRRNVYREREVEPQAVASLAAYMGRNYSALQPQSIALLQQGAVQFSN